MSLGSRSGPLVGLAYGCTTSVSDHECLCQREAPCEDGILHNILRGGEGGGGEGKGEEGRGRGRRGIEGMAGGGEEEEEREGRSDTMH